MSSGSNPAEPAAPTAESMARIEILLEDIRDQNRSTIEAVFAMGESLRRHFDEQILEIKNRLDVLEKVVREHSIDLRELRDEVRKNSEDIAHLMSAVERLERSNATTTDRATLLDLERRVTALEARLHVSAP